MRQSLEIIGILVFLVCVGKCVSSCAHAPVVSTWSDGTAKRLCTSTGRQIQIIDATENQRLSILLREAKQLWHEWLGREVFVSEPRAVQSIVISRELTRDIWHEAVRWDLIGRAGDGCVSAVSLEVAPHVLELTNRQMLAILAHELGHLLGLAHSTSRDSLMYPYIQNTPASYSKIPRPTEEGLRFVRALWGARGAP
jgi:hypothetical protein